MPSLLSFCVRAARPLANMNAKQILAINRVHTDQGVYVQVGELCRQTQVPLPSLPASEQH